MVSLEKELSLGLPLNSSLQVVAEYSEAEADDARRDELSAALRAPTAAADGLGGGSGGCSDGGVEGGVTAALSRGASSGSDLHADPV